MWKDRKKRGLEDRQENLGGASKYRLFRLKLNAT
jgi:hypothetical protein